MPADRDRSLILSGGTVRTFDDAGTVAEAIGIERPSCLPTCKPSWRVVMRSCALTRARLSGRRMRRWSPGPNVTAVETCTRVLAVDPDLTVIGGDVVFDRSQPAARTSASQSSGFAASKPSVRWPSPG
jgi:hypothetical protein